MVDLSTLGDGFRRLQKLQKDLDNLELNEAIVDLRSQVMEMQQENLELREANMRLKREAEEAKAADDFLDSLIDVDGYLYKRDENGKPVDYPYCAKCLKHPDGPFKMVRQNEVYSRCPNCGQKFAAAKDGRANSSWPNS